MYNIYHFTKHYSQEELRKGYLFRDIHRLKQFSRGRLVSDSDEPTQIDPVFILTRATGVKFHLNFNDYFNDQQCKKIVGGLEKIFGKAEIEPIDKGVVWIIES